MCLIFILLVRDLGALCGVDVYVYVDVIYKYLCPVCILSLYDYICVIPIMLLQDLSTLSIMIVFKFII